MASTGHEATCVCDACLPLRFMELQNAPLRTQRDFWQRSMAPVPVPTPPAAPRRGSASSPSRAAPPAPAPRRYSVPGPSSPSPLRGPAPLLRPAPPVAPPQRPSTSALPRATQAVDQPRASTSALVDQSRASTSAPPNQSRPSTSDQAPSASPASDLILELPENVARYVPYLAEAFQLLQQSLETAGPRRRECMHEAMEKVIQTYARIHPNVEQAPAAALSIEDRLKNVTSHIYDFKYSSSVDPTVKRERCTICHSKISHGDEYLKLPCQHMFHKECFKELLENNKTCTNCPVCRGDFTTTQP